MKPITASASQEMDVELESGRLRIHLWRPESAGAPTVLCIPGLSSNATGFDRIASAVVAAGHQVAAIDLRGRGGSDNTAPGTYGWPAHAQDVLRLADVLGLERFDVLGHSMGAYVAMTVAGAAPARVRRLVLIDGAGVPETAALVPIANGLKRLDRWHRSEDEYVEMVRSAGVVAPWNELWERFYRYELEHGIDGQVRSTTSLAATIEDVTYGKQHRQDALWKDVRCPTLLLRATVPLGEGGGFIVAAADAERFPSEVPGASVVSIEANHFGILTDERTADEVVQFLRQ